MLFLHPLKWACMYGGCVLYSFFKQSPYFQSFFSLSYFWVVFLHLFKFFSLFLCKISVNLISRTCHLRHEIVILLLVFFFYCCHNKLWQTWPLRTTGQKLGPQVTQWFLCFGSYKVELWVLAGLPSFLEALGMSALLCSFRSLAEFSSMQL